MTEAFKIDRNVPPPAKRRTVGTQFSKALARLEVGDSFEVPYDPAENPGVVRSRLSVHAAGKLGKGNYTIRKTEAGYRVWRTG